MNALSIITITVMLSVFSAASGFEYDGPGLSKILPFGDCVLAVTWGFESLLHFGPDGSHIAILMCDEDAVYGSAPSAREGTAAVLLNLDGFDYVQLFTVDSILNTLGPYERSGKPSFDGPGNLWFCGDGYLLRNGVSTGYPLNSHTISINHTGEWVSFCDSNDRICIMDTGNGETSVIASDYRFYNPQFVRDNGVDMIVSPSLEGRIVKIDPSDGTCTPLAEGSNPFWWEEGEAILFSRTSDDGHDITSGEIWLVSLEGSLRQLTFSPDVHEVQPIAAGGNIYAIDALSGSPTVVTLE
jgi:hypothetical protein